MRKFEDKDLPLRDRNGLFVCPKPGCNKVFNWRYNIHAHLRMHTGEMPFTCERCNKKFRWRSGWKNHVRQLQCSPRRLVRIWEESADVMGQVPLQGSDCMGLTSSSSDVSALRPSKSEPIGTGDDHGFYLEVGINGEMPAQLKDAIVTCPCGRLFLERESREAQLREHPRARAGASGISLAHCPHSRIGGSKADTGSAQDDPGLVPWLVPRSSSLSQSSGCVTAASQEKPAVTRSRRQARDG